MIFINDSRTEDGMYLTESDEASRLIQELLLLENAVLERVTYMTIIFALGMLRITISAEPAEMLRLRAEVGLFEEVDNLQILPHI